MEETITIWNCEACRFNKRKWTSPICVAFVTGIILYANVICKYRVRLCLECECAYVVLDQGDCNSLPKFHLNSKQDRNCHQQAQNQCTWMTRLKDRERVYYPVQRRFRARGGRAWIRSYKPVNPSGTSDPFIQMTNQ